MKGGTEVWWINIKTGESGVEPLDKAPIIKQNAAALEAATNLLAATKDMKELKDMNAKTVKTISTLLKTIETETGKFTKPLMSD